MTPTPCEIFRRLLYNGRTVCGRLAAIVEKFCGSIGFALNLRSAMRLTWVLDLWDCEDLTDVDDVLRVGDGGGI